MSPQTQQNDKWRLSLIFLTAFFVLVILIARLFQVQIIEREGYALIGENQYKTKLQLPARRGKIYDREYRSLALNTPSISVGAHPKIITNKTNAAQQLSSLLNRDSAHLRAKLFSDDSFVWLARGLPRNKANDIKMLEIGGIEILSDVSRCYPHTNLAAHLMGFTDIDGNGLGGIEYSFDEILKGKPGEAVLQLTANGKSFERVEYPLMDPQNGYNLVLTIDQAYQAIVEEELQETVETSGALGGSVIVTNPYTGEILSIANTPNFQPSKAGQYHPSTWRLRPVTDQMEPGSTFKIAMMAAIIEEGIKAPQDIVYCEQGEYEFRGETIHDTKEHGWLTMHNVIVYSSNIGMAKTLLEVPPETIYQYARDFGFGMKTNIGYEGENKGILKLPTEWSGYTPAAMAMGYEIAATPLQMVGMFNVIANGGFLMKPMIVKEILNGTGEPIDKHEPQIIRRVISQSTVKILTTMMEDVVTIGTGKRAAIEGIRICGKTGTAQKVKKDGRGYFGDQNISSFGGFFPAEGKEKRCIFIVIDTPKYQTYGGDIAAPCFKKIAQRIIELEGSDKFFHKEKTPVVDMVTVPMLIGRDLKTVREILGQLGLLMKSAGDGEIIADQELDAGNIVHKDSEIVIELTPIPNNDEERTVPDVVGLHLREALNKLAVHGVDAVVNGSGKVIKQQPTGGTRIKAGEQCLIECESAIDLIGLLNL